MILISKNILVVHYPLSVKYPNFRFLNFGINKYISRV